MAVESNKQGLEAREKDMDHSILEERLQKHIHAFCAKEQGHTPICQYLYGVEAVLSAMKHNTWSDLAGGIEDLVAAHYAA